MINLKCFLKFDFKKILGTSCTWFYSQYSYVYSVLAHK